MYLDSKKVERVFMDCLLGDDTPKDIRDAITEKCRSSEAMTTLLPEYDAVAQIGIVCNVVFRQSKLKEHNEDIDNFISELKPEFFESTGGGHSFLVMPFDKNNRQWAEHKQAEMLTQLIIASGKGQYLVDSKKLWRVLPGGVPYIVIYDKYEYYIE